MEKLPFKPTFMANNFFKAHTYGKPPLSKPFPWKKATPKPTFVAKCTQTMFASPIYTKLPSHYFTEAQLPWELRIDQDSWQWEHPQKYQKYSFHPFTSLDHGIHDQGKRRILNQLIQHHDHLNRKSLVCLGLGASRVSLSPWMSLGSQVLDTWL